MDLGLTGRVAVVGGAGSGLGLACARALAAEGAHVVLTGRRANLLAEQAAALPSALAVPADLTDPAAPDRVVRAAEEAFGPVDVVVLNGGGPPPGAAADLDDAAVTGAIESLLLPHRRMVAAVLPGMRDRRHGRIVAVGSSGVQEPLDRLALSNLGRAALAGYLKTLAAEVAADGVTVNLVLPGRIDTGRVAQLDAAAAARAGADPAAVRAASEASIPAGRYGRPEEFAAVVAFLAGDPAGYVTGEQVRCDGGKTRAY